MLSLDVLARLSITLVLLDKVTAPAATYMPPPTPRPPPLPPKATLRVINTSEKLAVPAV